MNKKMMRQVMLFAAGAIAVIYIPQLGNWLGTLLNKPLTYGD